MSTLELTALSGKKHIFTYYSWLDIWNHVPGLYAFVNLLGNPKYIGEASDFATRMPGHEKWAEAQHYGAISVVALVHFGTVDQRKADEADLIRAYNPPCNVLHRTSGQLGGLGRLSGLS